MSPADIKGQKPLEKPLEEMRMSGLLKSWIMAAAFGFCTLSCQQVSAQSKDAEPATRAANEASVGVGRDFSIVIASQRIARMRA
jgi:hypothetical protein